VLDNLTLLAAIIILFWLGAIAYFFYTSRQQREIQEELDALRQMLENDAQEPHS
jgi:preprotein translocase subunit YajC